VKERNSWVIPRREERGINSEREKCTGGLRQGERCREPEQLLWGESRQIKKAVGKKNKFLWEKNY